MAARIIQKRARYFVAVEGESEQSFVRWLQQLSDGRVPVHLDSYPLSGGGYKSMLENAVHLHVRQSKSKGAYRERFLIIDGDRAEQGDWSLDKLREEAAKHEIIVCVQRPKLEGLLYRMMPGKERDIPSAALAESKLKAFWPSYQKPVNAHLLEGRFSLGDLARVAVVDADLEILLQRIGLI
jgi:hypothetical protein